MQNLCIFLANLLIRKIRFRLAIKEVINAAIGTKRATRCPFLGPTPLIQVNTEIVKYKHKDVVKNAELYLAFL